MRIHGAGLLWLVAVVALAPSSLGAQTLTDDQLIQQFMPPAFTAYAAEHPYLTDDRTWSVLHVDLDGTGTPSYVAIGYSNGHIGYLRVVRIGQSPALVGESTPSVSCESIPLLIAVDLDGDGRPELDFQCASGNRGTEFSSLFKWTGSGISPLNVPSAQRAGAWAPVRGANFIDLDGDGTLEVLETTAQAEVDDSGAITQDYDVYHLVGGKLAKSSTKLIYFEQFLRHTGKPVTQTSKFTADPGTYVMTIVNGQRGDHMVDSAVILVNGTPLVSRSAFSNRSRVIRTDVQLGAVNTVSVELNSAPDSFVFITVTPSP